ncbi:8185_t:CDS:2, partial [Cetraspora pellucida]
IREMCLKESSMPSCLDNKEFAALKAFCQLLKPFESAILMLSKEQSNSISDAIMLEHLKATLIEVSRYSKNKVDLFVNNIQKKIISYETKYTNTEPLNIEVSVTININNEFIYNFLFPKRISKKRKYNKNSIESKLELYEDELLEDFTNNIKKKENNRILFWKLLSKSFLILSKIACNYLSIKPSSVSSERAFSRVGFTITNDKATISEKTVSNMILMHS